MFLLSSTLYISLASLFSRLLGVFRENLLARAFGGLTETGANPLDAYYAAFRVPDFIYNLLILSVGAAIFVPVLTREIKKNQKQAWQLTSNLFNLLFVALILVSGIAYLCAPLLIQLLGVGFSPETQQLTVELTRIMLLSPIFFGLSSLVGSLLSVFKNFVSYTLSPIIYNLGIIAGIIILVPHYGVYGVAYGVVAGAFLHFAVQLPALLKQGFKYQFVFNWKIPELREIVRLALPRFLGLSATQLNLVVDTVIGSTLVAGSLTILNWTQNLQFLPIGLIGISLSITAFVALADSAATQDKKSFQKKLEESIKVILFLAIPATVGMFLLKTEIVGIVLNYGAFAANSENILLSAGTLGFFSLSLVFQCLLPLLAKAFYAWQDTWTPVKNTFWQIGLNIAFSIFFAKILNLGVIGLGIAFSLASTFGCVLLIYQTRQKIAPLPWRNFSREIGQMLLASLLMSGVIIILLILIQSLLLKLVLGILGGAAAYLVVLHLFHNPTLLSMKQKMRQKR